MTMFKQSLEYREDSSVTSKLVNLFDAYYEFNCYCAFLHQAHLGIVSLDVELDPKVIEGINMSGRCLSARSEEILEQVNRILMLEKKESKEKSKKKDSG